MKGTITMTKLEWCKKHAPGYLQGGSELEILIAMSPYYDENCGEDEQE